MKVRQIRCDPLKLNVLRTCETCLDHHRANVNIFIIDDKPRKRGRPPKAVKIGESPITQGHPEATPNPVHTPRSAHHPPSQASPSEASPTKTTPTKPLKALPTVRDHTSNELNETKDEYIPREFDDAGEKKVAPNGAPLGGRQYRCRTFFLPNRGDKLFMLATECAKVLGYRDSYLLFNKNRSLHKIIADQEEKNDLIQQDILPSSYRSRQIAIVTARSMYRQFGSRLIVNGRRVRDDYWEFKARKQGFTEDDPAGEKRPGAGKAAREAAAAAAEASNAAALAAVPHGQIIYQATEHAKQYPMINLDPASELGDFSNVPRPRQDIPPSAYDDRTAPSGTAEIMTHATQTAEYNQGLSTQRRNRTEFISDMWHRAHEPPVTQAGEGDGRPSSSQAHPSQLPTGSIMNPQQQLGHSAQPQHQMMAPQAYPQQAMSHMIGQSPGRPAPQQLPGGQMHRPGVPGGPGGNYQYGYAQNQMWAAAGQAGASIPQPGIQYGHHVQQQSPHMPQTAIHPSQLHPAGATQMHAMGYNVPGGAGGYGNVQRQIYQGPGGQQYIQQQQQQQQQQQGHAAVTQPGVQGWSQAPAHGQSGQQNWQQGF
jgi:Chromatin remodelling complex Rsc7/Swp82 subunit